LVRFWVHVPLVDLGGSVGPSGHVARPVNFDIRIIIRLNTAE